LLHNAEHCCTTLNIAAQWTVEHCCTLLYIVVGTYIVAQCCKMLNFVVQCCTHFFCRNFSGLKWQNDWSDSQ
jgi:hypothetical protein